MVSKRPNNEEFVRKEPKVKKAKVFDFLAFPKRKIALQFFYFGWEYDGLVQQTNTNNTVEHHLMEALLKTHLIENWQKCDFSRCGRTDKGVSAFKQTAALIVRSNIYNPEMLETFWDPETPEEVQENYKNREEELNYIKMLNGVLPKTIRVFRWAPVGKDFNARFQCTRRSYKYAYPKAEDLNLSKMRDAGSRLVGEHDFSNFCQIDMNKLRLEQSYIRKIYAVSIEEVSLGMLQITVDGSGFLWHMIRYIVTILNEVGRGNEEPQIVTEMLDLSKFPCRPQYTLSSDTPLCLFDCRYENCELEWRTDEVVMNSTIAMIQKQWAIYQARSQMMENMMGELSSLTSSLDPNKALHEFVQDRPIPQNYVKFANRPKCISLTAKRERLAEIEKSEV
ncbi:unnamed protein product [Caenorhabditis angaria]|uniref:tRNA pseudouridine synthase n=1 Tax=Caenorhabditis angaria TaxID=860376 RepID=A0A9P1ICR6_9PELO|nr:unnamed protein product [Caenorhabditis angaria]